MTECKYNKCERCGYANECEIKAVLDKQEKSIFQITEWMYDYKGNLEKARWLLSNVLKLLENYKKTNDLATVKEIKNFLKETE